ncbi:hypothetical protein BHE74_00026330 [Ensete ventricosum]|nr:hypothetical protein BHE74_00026330 [Ensete ventricosum]
MWSVDHGFPYRSIPPVSGDGTAKIDRRRSSEGEKGKKRKRRKKKRRRRIPRAVLARTSSLPAGDFSHARGERSRRLPGHMVDIGPCLDW